MTPDDAVVIVPNAFSPNGDGHNDLLTYFTHNLVSIEFSIYNRWGQKVFESNDASVFWDGKVKGTIQASGVFVYQVKANTTSGKKLQASGNFTLLR